MGKVNKNEDMSDEKTRDKRIVAIATIIGALTAILISMIAARDYFAPTFVNVVVIVLLVMIVIVNGYGIFGDKIIRCVKKVVKERRENKLANNRFNEFDRFMDKFGEFVEPRRCDNIVYTLTQIKNKEAVFSDILLLSAEYFNDIFIVLREAFQKSRRNKESLLLLIKCFEVLLNAYNKLYICEPVEQIRSIQKESKNDITKERKEEYRKHKAIYDKFVIEYMDFAKVINKTFNERVARVYFERPKEL